MADKLTLNDLNGLGLNKVSTDSPADKAANDPNAVPINKEENTHTVKDGVEVIKPKTQSIQEPPKPVENKPNISTPNNKVPGATQYGETIDISKVPTKHEKTPYERTRDDLLEKVDKNIERTKQELSKPGGRIDQAKRMYIDDRYAKIVARAKNNKRLAEHIKAVNDFMDTDPRFDGISTYERRGYIVFAVGKDEGGLNDDYFGKRTETGTTINVPRLSSDANREINQYTQKEVDDSFLYDDNSKVVLSNGEPSQNVSSSNSKKKESDDDNKEDDDLLLSDPNESSIAEMKDTPTTTTTESTKEEDEEIDLSLDDEDTNKSTDTKEDDSSDDEEELSREEQMERLKTYKKQIVDALKLDKSKALDGFTISAKPIKLNMALASKKIETNTSLWGLQYTGTPIEMTPMTGEELLLLNPNNSNFDTVAGLKSFFSVLYHHVKNANKPPFETWLKQISDNDVDGLLFAAYLANFKDTNYITYACPKKSCSNIFIEKKDIKDMVIYPNKETEDRFNQILRKEPVDSQMYKSKPIFINEDYAVGLVTQSLYSAFFEPAALNEEFTKKFQTIINIMPNIDRLYRIDNVNKLLIPIEYKTIENSLSKTVQSKVRTLNTIIKTFSPDEAAILAVEAAKISSSLDANKITYQIPETVCPVCGTKIPATTYNPLQLLFTRAQLPTIAASIQE